MNASIKTAGEITPPCREHSLSHNPVIRAVIKAGSSKLWGTKDLEELLGVSERSAQCLLADGIPSSLKFPAKGSGRSVRKVTSGSLLLYLLKNAREEPQSEVLAALGLIVDELPTAVLSQLVGFLQKKITRRASRLVVVVSEAEPGSSKPSGQLDFFTSPNP